MQMKNRSRTLSIVLILALVLILAAGVASQVKAIARAGISATAATSSRELDAAIGLFERFNPELVAPNRTMKVGSRWIAPAFAPLRFSNEGVISDLVTHMTDTLVPGEMNELQMYLPTPSETTGLSLPALSASSGPDAYSKERLLNSVAFVEGGVRPQMDMLVRPTALGFSAYIQFRSRSTAEQVPLQSGVSCAPLSSELIRRLQPGVFVIEQLIQEREAECERYSRSLVPVKRPIEPADTYANYQRELRLIRAATRRARLDYTTMLAVVSATTARDADGHAVPTDMAWRYDEEPVLRVHHKARRYRYPIVARIDFIAAARQKRRH
jgi:hypothetical protein